MSKMTMLLGPPRDKGMFDSILASVKAVATSPSASTCEIQNRLTRTILSPNSEGFQRLCTSYSGL